LKEKEKRKEKVENIFFLQFVSKNFNAVLNHVPRQKN